MRQSPFLFLPALLLIFPAAPFTVAQLPAANTPLQAGQSIERTLGAGQSHNYTVNLDEGQFLQLVVDQRGIDVIVRVFSPRGKRLGEFDSPNGDEGPENVTVVAITAGTYRIEVAPLGQTYNATPGRYEIRITEIRKATEQELQAGNNEEQLKTKGRALLTQAIELFPQVHRPETRANFQSKAAQLLWDTDQKRAVKLFQQSIDSVKEFIEGLDAADQNYDEHFYVAQQLRQDLVNALTPRDPDMALQFLRSTRSLVSPQGSAAAQAKQEQQLELSLIGQLAAKDPARAFEMAEDSLKAGSSTGLTNVLNQLRGKDSDLALRLAHDIAAKLEDERFFQNTEAGFLAINFLQMARIPNRSQLGNGDGSQTLISEDEYRDLFLKTLSEALAYQLPATNSYTTERNLAVNILSSLKRMNNEVQTYAPDKKAALDEKLLAVQTAGEPRNAWARYQATINEAPVDTALESIGQAPPDLRDSLYQQLANKVIQSGDSERAQQIVTQRIVNPMQRRQMMRELDRQAIYAAVNKGRIDDAIRLLANVRPLNDRAGILADIATRIGPGLKRAAALGYLEQLAAMLDLSGKAADQSQMNARLQMAHAFARYDMARAFDMIDPLLDQFNDLAAAAMIMSGFGQKYYEDGELIMNNGNSMADVANRLGNSLAVLGIANFDRAKTAADRIRPAEVRLSTYLLIAQRAVQETRGGVLDF
jgi:hypothetical protein